MKARKIVLLSLIVILLGVYIFQLVSTGTGSVRQVTLEGEPDKIILESAVNGKIVLTKTDEGWRLGENQQYAAQETEVNSFIDALSTYSVLQTVSKGGDEVLYGLDDASKITVSLYQNGEILTQLDVGKDAATLRQSYIRMAGEKDILLVSDSYHSVFDVTSDDVRIRRVYMLDEADIKEAALISTEAGIVLMSRDENGEWVGNYTQMTPEGIASWISTVSTLNTASWLPDDWEPTSEPVCIVSLKLDDRVVTDYIYAVEGEEDSYIGTSTETPYAFTMSAYTADKFLRTADDFDK